MKKFISLLLSICLALCVFSACGEKTPSETPAPTPTPDNPPTIQTMITEVGKTTNLDSVSLCQGDEQQYKILKSDGTDTNVKWQWTTNNNCIRISAKTSVAASCFVTVKALTPGTAVLSASKDGEVIDTLNITVSEFKIESSVENIDLYLDGDKSFNLKEKITATSLNGLQFSSNSENVATVSESGIVTAVSKGKTEIVVKNSVANVSITVPVTVHPSCFYSNTDSLLIEVDEEFPLEIITELTDINYSTSNSNVATVLDGVIKGVGLGTATITAKSGEYQVTVEVTVVQEKINTVSTNSLQNEYVNFFGRNDVKDNAVNIYYGAAGIEVTFYGTELKAELKSLGLNNERTPYAQVLVDNEYVPLDDGKAQIVTIDNKEYEQKTIVSGLTKGIHTVKLLKRTAYYNGSKYQDAFSIKSISTNADGYILYKPELKDLKIEVYGDSISTGYGNVGAGTSYTSENSNALLTCNYLVAEKLNAQINIQAHSGWGVYIDSGGKNDNQWYNKYDKYPSPTGGTTTYDFAYQPDLVIINLGTNDTNGFVEGAKATYSSQEFVAKYKEMVLGIKNKCPNAKFLLCYGMMGANQTIVSDIQTVANEINTQLGVGTCHALTLQTNGYNTAGHPTHNSHVSNSNIIYNYIINNNLNVVSRG